MLFKLMKLKVNEDETVDLPEGCIVTRVISEPDMFQQDPKNWPTYVFGLEPVRPVES